MQYAISQLVLDVVGDLLSTQGILKLTKSRTHACHSRLHAFPVDLASETPADPEMFVSMLAMLDGCCDHLDSHSSQWP